MPKGLVLKGFMPKGPHLNVRTHHKYSHHERPNPKPVIKCQKIKLYDKLSWQKHIAVLETKLSSAIGAMFKLQKHSSQKALITVYHSIVYSHLQSAILAWG